VQVYAFAAARFLFGMWIARPSAARPASLIASLSVGCGAMPSPTVSTVDSASIAITPASIMSVTCGPTITSPSSSPYFVSWIDLTQAVVGLDALALVELHAGRLEADALDDRPAADRDEHQVAVDGLALAEMHGQRVALLLDLRALLAEVQRDAALAEDLRELLRRVGVLLRDQRVEHLDDR